MAAIVYPEPISAPGAPQPRRKPMRTTGTRPELRVIQGGRSPQAMAKVYRRRRVLAVVLLLAVVITGAIVIRAGLHLAYDAATPSAVVPAVREPLAGERVIVVQPGDTLTSIARALQPEGDISPLVARLTKAHGPQMLMAGDRLIVPVNS